MAFTSILLGLYVLFLIEGINPVAVGIALPPKDAPQVTLRNGSYYGVHNAHYNQDFFLGVPFAQPPVGDLRLRQPRSLNTSWTGLRNVTQYGYACVGYGEDTYIGGNDYVSEDCLTLNIIRPSGYEDKKLPIGVWIYGGGWFEGTSLDPRYNLTYIVQQSVEIGKPIIGVSINYRLHGWGWLYSQEVLDAGVTNLGLRDQRLALQWLQENIGAFGGNCSQVTIWGESAGAASVGFQLLAYNGRDDGLFHGAISESGPLVGVGLTNPTRSASERAFEKITTAAGCGSAKDKLACLRLLSFEKYNHVLKTAVPTETYYQVIFGPLVDGDIVARSSVAQLAAGAFVKVPYIMGDNADDGTDFVPFGINTDAHFRRFFAGYNISAPTLTSLAALYPNSPRTDIPASHPRPFNRTIGAQFKRAATLAGDITFKAPRRLSAAAWLNHTAAPLYTYLFDTIPNGIPLYWSVTHFQEVAFVFHNIHGAGYPGTSPPYFGPDPFAGEPESYKRLATLMSRMWAAFIATGDPNWGQQDAPEWPTYGEGKEVIVFDARKGSYLEADTYREEGIEFLVDKYREGRYPWGAHELS